MNETKRERSWYRVIVVLLCIALGLVSIQNSQLRSEKTRKDSIVFKDQFQEGKACGLMTRGEASRFLGQDAILDSASIVSAISPTASTRGGSPRVDGCTYVVPTSNASYVDVVIKTYESEKIAARNFEKDTSKVLFIEDVKNDLMPTVQRLRYSSGVHYVLLGRDVYEISAAKVGASTGKELRAFSETIVTFIVTKL